MNPQQGRDVSNYLDQISAPVKQGVKFELNVKNIIILSVALILVVGIAGSIIKSAIPSKVEPWQQLSARINATVPLVDKSSKGIKNSQLRSLNSDVKLYLTNTQRDLNQQLTLKGIKPEKLPEKILAAESSEKMAGRMEDGRLNAKLDSTYVREMSYQLGMILSLIDKMYIATDNPDSKKFLETAYRNLEPIHKAIQNFSADNE